jgi:hypothetical protein
MGEVTSSAGESSRKDGRKVKESRKHRQNASSEVDPVAAYSITLNYGGKDGKAFSKKDDSKSYRKK